MQGIGIILLIGAAAAGVATVMAVAQPKKPVGNGGAVPGGALISGSVTIT